MKMDGKFMEDFAEDEGMEVAAGKEHKSMTMEDVAHELKKGFADEIADSKKYHHMAKIAEKAHCEEDCHYLMEMAKDEYTHAYFIHNFMKEHDIHIPEEHEEEFEHLTEEMKGFFQ